MKPAPLSFFHSKSILYDVHTNSALSQSEFKNKVVERAESLRVKNIGALDHVLLAKPNGVDFFIDLFALWELQAFPFICSSELKEHELQTLQDRINPKALLAKHDEFFSATTKHQAPLPEDTAFVLFTSGTSAQPKAVIHTFRNLKEKLEIFNSSIAPESRKTTLCALPLHFAHGLLGISLSTLYLGGQLCLLPALGLENISHLQQWLDKIEPTFISGTPATWSLLLRFAKPPKTPLLRAQVASAHTSAELFEKIKTWARSPVFNAYGMTETGSWVSDYEFRSAGDENRVGNGKKWGTSFEILNPDREGIGEIRVNASGISPGYWDFSENNNPFSEKSFVTGDFGTLNENGELKLIGRLSRVVNKGGFKVSAEEVEQVLVSQRHIIDAAVFGSGPQNSQLVAMLVIEDGQDSEKLITNLITELAQKISSHKIPSEFKVVNAIPRKKNGKPDLLAIKTLWDKT